MAETCRKEGLNLGFIEPSYQQLPITKLILETIDMDIDKRITRVAVRDTYTEEYMGAIYLKVLDEDDKDWILYNERKDKFIDDTKKGKFVGAKINYNQIVDDVISDTKFKEYKNKKEQRAYLLITYNTLTLSEIDTILSLITVRLRKNE